MGDREMEKTKENRGKSLVAAKKRVEELEGQVAELTELIERARNSPTPRTGVQEGDVTPRGGLAFTIFSDGEGGVRPYPADDGGMDDKREDEDTRAFYQAPAVKESWVAQRQAEVTEAMDKLEKLNRAKQAKRTALNELLDDFQKLASMKALLTDRIAEITRQIKRARRRQDICEELGARQARAELIGLGPRPPSGPPPKRRRGAGRASSGAVGGPDLLTWEADLPGSRLAPPPLSWEMHERARAAAGLPGRSWPGGAPPVEWTPREGVWVSAPVKMEPGREVQAGLAEENEGSALETRANRKAVAPPNFDQLANQRNSSETQDTQGA